MKKQDEMVAAIHKAVRDTLSEIGLDEFKKTSFFASNWKDSH